VGTEPLGVRDDRSVERCDILLTGGTVVTVDDERRVLEDGAVAITGDRIVAVGAANELRSFAARRTVDCTGKVVMPGIVDCHQHLFQYLGRGLGEGMELWPWLCEFMFPFAGAISREEAVAAVRLAAVEAARAGTTTIVDNHYSPADAETTIAVAGSIESVGLRGVVARGMFGPKTTVAKEHGLPDVLFRYSTEEELDVTRACIDARRGRRVTVWPAPINVIYNEQDLVGRAIELARSSGTGWHTHCSEAPIDPEIYEEAYGARPIDWLYGEGLLGRGATIAHAIWLSDREIERMGETETAVSYNPVSNENLASGVMRLRELRAAGVAVGLGGDGAGGHRLDGFELMKAGMLLQRVGALDAAVTNGEEAIELATREGARYVGLDAGVLASGKLADVIVVALDRPHLKPVHRAVATLTYAARGSDVEMTIVGGDVIFENGAVSTVDERDVMDEAQARADELVRRAGIEVLRMPWRRGSVHAGGGET
jgi:5-methylthioadenosine/S-adenosylhomocysteine deaminase